MIRLKNNIEKLIQNSSGEISVYIKSLKDFEGIFINQEKRFHAASIIKLPILFEALRQIEKNQIRLTDKIYLRKEDKVGGCGVLQILHDELELTLEDLLYLMIDISDNTATNMLIEYLGKENINRTLQELGMENTLVARKLMLTEPGVYSYTNGQDIGRLLEKFVQCSLDNKVFKKGLEILFNQQYNDRLSKELILCGQCSHRIGTKNYCDSCGANMKETEAIPVKFAHKTGEIVGVVHDAGILYIEDNIIVVVVLTGGLENNEEGYKLLSDIGIATYEFLHKK